MVAAWGPSQWQQLANRHLLRQLAAPAAVHLLWMLVLLLVMCLQAPHRQLAAAVVQSVWKLVLVLVMCLQQAPQQTARCRLVAPASSDS